MITHKKPPYKIDSAKICHIGVGNFHRAHQAVYTENAMLKTQDFNWGVCGIGLLPSDIKFHNILKSQNYLYTLLSKSNDNIEPKIIGSINQLLHLAEDFDKIIAKIADFNTSLITLTITEGGYYINQNTGEFDSKNQNILHDLNNPNNPKTVYGLLLAGLIARKKLGNNHITLLSCDNISENGNKFKKAFFDFLSLTNAAPADFKSWLEEFTSFPNCMVDRITPRFNPADIQYCQNELGYTDNCPISSEDYLQWIIEDNFVAERPKWEEVGVNIVKDVTPYEHVKLRLLNASHTALAFMGLLKGHITVDQAITDPEILSFVKNYMKLEASQGIKSLPGLDLDKYQEDVIRRFSNKQISDSLLRISSFTSDKIVAFVLPTLLENLGENKSIDYSSAIIANWYLYLQNFFVNNDVDLLEDNNKILLKNLIDKSHDDPSNFIKEQSIFSDLSSSDQFMAAFLSLVK